MKHLSTKFRLAVAAALFVGVSSAHAADFTFNVSVGLKSILPAEVTAGIQCQVYSVVPPPGLGTIPTGAHYVGGGSTAFKVSKGGFVGTIAVPVNAAAGKDPATARGYICTLNLAGQPCVVTPDAQPCRGTAAAGNSVEVKGEISAR